MEDWQRGDRHGERQQRDVRLLLDARTDLRRDGGCNPQTLQLLVRGRHTAAAVHAGSAGRPEGLRGARHLQYIWSAVLVIQLVPCSEEARGSSLATHVLSGSSSFRSQGS